MKKKLHGILYFFCITTFLFAFSCGVLATQIEDYANKEGDENDSSISTLSILPSIATASSDGNLIVVLDPGHGDDDSGAYNQTYGVKERDLNLKVALYCKKYLENNYSNVTVLLTRSDNSTNPDLEQRAVIAANYGADLMISLHFNATDGDTTKAYGCETYVSRLDEYSLNGLASQIVSNLNALGIKTWSEGHTGVYTKASLTKTYWTDNIRLADYYGIIKHPAYREIPSMIVEHCFLSNNPDYTSFASSDAKLKALGEADAKAIATYFNLGNESSTTIENTRVTAKNQLNTYYNSLDYDDYTDTYETKIESIYQDALNRIETAKGTGKINLTLNRALKTIENYPISCAGFYDVKKSDWFSGAVIYSVNNNLFYGTTDTTFSPQSSITRGMFITILGRNSGVSGTTPASTKFSDVNSSLYYAPYIAWASENGIVEGLRSTTYGPDTAITREDLIAMLYRYSNLEHIEITDSTGKTIANFNDSAKVDTWALDAMNWAIDCGIINGDDSGNLNPRSYTKRAEAAIIMMAFNQKSK